MTADAETVVRQAYHAAQGNVLDVQGFVDLFAEDGVFNNVVAGESYRGEHLGDLVVYMGKPVTFGATCASPVNAANSAWRWPRRR